jgi:lipopolysaccharide export system permease protein
MLNIKVLDKYFMRQYLATVLFSLLICTLITVAIDFSDKVQSIIEKPCTWKDILAYYVGFTLHMAGLLLPLYTLIGVVFFTSRLAFNSEILSVLNAGVSFNRLMRPYLMAGALVVSVHLLLNHLVIPYTNVWKLYFENTFVWTDQEKGRTSNVHFLVSPDTKVYIRGYNKNNQSGTGLRLEKFVDNRISSILEADNLKWKPDAQRWELSSYSVRTFDGLHESYKRYNTPLDTAINLSPQDFIYYQNQNQAMTTGELMAAIDRDRNRGIANRSYEIEMQRRTADAFTNIILTIIGLAVAGRKVRGGMGLHLALGIGIGASFILLSKFAVSFAISGTVPVLVGMWIPNMFFGAIAIWLVSRAQK